VAIMTVRGHACVVDAVLFDKDGTLIEFDPLWCGWALTVIERLSRAAGVPTRRLADAIGLDLDRHAHVPEGPLAVGTMRDLATVLAHQLYEAGFAWGAARDAVEHELTASEPELGERAEIRPLPGVTALLERLADLGVPCGVVTSDDTPRARQHLRLAGMDGHLGVVVGADRVRDGGKPSPQGVLLACEELDVAPERAVLIGDSEGDMRAAAAAGLAAGFHLTSTAGAPRPGAHPVADLTEIAITVTSE
jgi:phosphoglycolate phosphatase